MFSGEKLIENANIFLIMFFKTNWAPAGIISGMDGQWEKALHGNAFFHWLSPYPEWSLHQYSKVLLKHSNI